jgi:hypothetical protein
MIHYTPEGHTVRIGLNITCGVWRKPYVTFRWVWYDTATRMLSYRRLRIRLYQLPVIIWGSDKASVVDGWMWEKDMVPVYRALLEDEAPRILALMDIYKKHDYPPEGTEIKISKDEALSIL